MVTRNQPNPPDMDVKARVRYLENNLPVLADSLVCGAVVEAAGNGVPEICNPLWNSLEDYFLGPSEAAIA